MYNDSSNTAVYCNGEMTNRPNLEMRRQQPVANQAEVILHTVLIPPILQALIVLIHTKVTTLSASCVQYGGTWNGSYCQYSSSSSYSPPVRRLIQQL